MASSASYARLLTPPKGSFFLFGPRGTGKSTWLASAFPDAHVIDLLDEALYQSYLADIGRLAERARACSGLMYANVPATSPLCDTTKLSSICAKPKSTSFDREEASGRSS